MKKLSINGTIIPGQGIATGFLVLQKPFFTKGGIDDCFFEKGSINVDISPHHWQIIKPDYDFNHILWRENFYEDFKFIKIQVKFEDKYYQALIYNPSRTENPKSMIEVLAPPIIGIEYGKKIELIIDQSKFKILD